MSSPWYEGWTRLAELTGVLACTYVVLVVMLRVSGKRTLAKLNAFDFVVTIALGSTLSTVAVSREVPLAEGVVVLGGLILLQYLAARAGRRWDGFGRLIKSAPTALVVDGRLREEDMAANRIRVEELGAALRKAGHASFATAACVVLETDGSFSVLDDLGDRSALLGVRGIEAGAGGPASSDRPAGDDTGAGGA
jgi:uncharacterized membrane protein YcaP (DUF421 family)